MIKKIILLVLLLAGWWSTRSWIRAQKIECYTQYGLCPEEMSADLGWLIQTPLLFPLPEQKVVQNLSSFPQIKSTRLYRRLPRTLVVSIDLRKPLGVVGPQILGTKAIADSDGVVIGLETESLLPQLLVSPEEPDLQLGDRLSGLQSQALKLLADIAEISEKQVLGRISGKELEVVLSDNILVLLNLDYVGTSWKSTLQLILDRSKIQAKVPKTIDLRYSSPILKY